MNFGDCRLERKATPDGEEASIDVMVDVGSQTVRVQRSTVEPELNFQRFLEELDRFLELAVIEEMDSMRAAWAPPRVETEDGDADTRRGRHNSDM